MGILGTIAGVLIGKRSERRGAHEAWLREKRLDVYTAVLEANNDMIGAVAALIECNLPDRAKAFDVVEMHGRRLSGLVDRIRLLDPPGVYDVARYVDMTHTGLLRSVHGNAKLDAIHAAKPSQPSYDMRDLVPEALSCDDVIRKFADVAAEASAHRADKPLTSATCRTRRGPPKRRASCLLPALSRAARWWG